jgi:hypothetical protein
MAIITSSLRRDANNVALQDVNGLTEIKSLTFSDTTGAQALFTVTGDVILRVFGICKVNLASDGGCNIEVGVAGATSQFITTTDATAVDANEIWHDATPDASIEADTVSATYIVSNGQDIILTPSAQIDSGRIDFYCQWRPLSTDASVVSA